MNEAVKDRPENLEVEKVVVERLKQAYKAAKQAPDHKGMIELPAGGIVYIIIDFEKPAKKRTKAQIEEAKKKIAKAVSKNEQLLKGTKISIKDILKSEQEIRSAYNKEHYGIDSD